MTDRSLPRRDMVPLWTAGGWFYWALSCLVLAAFASSLTETVIICAAAIPFAAVGSWRYLRVRRDPAKDGHRELLEALRSLPGERINRDERVVYTCQVKGRLPLTRTVTLVRVPEDDVLAVQREGSAQLVVHSWEVAPWGYGISRAMHGTRITGDDIESGVIRFPRTGMWQWQKAQRAARKAGMLYAPAEEVQSLISSLRASEPMSAVDDA